MYPEYSPYLLESVRATLIQLAFSHPISVIIRLSLSPTVINFLFLFLENNVDFYLQINNRYWCRDSGTGGDCNINCGGECGMFICSDAVSSQQLLSNTRRHLIKHYTCVRSPLEAHGNRYTVFLVLISAMHAHERMEVKSHAEYFRRIFFNPLLFAS
jgi:hypothetical protein